MQGHHHFSPLMIKPSRECGLRTIRNGKIAFSPSSFPPSSASYCTGMSWLSPVGQVGVTEALWKGFFYFFSCFIYSRVSQLYHMSLELFYPLTSLTLCLASCSASSGVAPGKECSCQVCSKTHVFLVHIFFFLLDYANGSLESAAGWGRS